MKENNSERIGVKKGRTDKGIFFIIVNVLVVLIIAIILLSGRSESDVIINDQSINISGMYGIEIMIDDIESIELRDSIPKIGKKINGLDILSTRKGTFRMDEIDRARLFIHSSQGPYIYMNTKADIIIINFKDSDSTRNIYNELGSIIEN